MRTFTIFLTILFLQTNLLKAQDAPLVIVSHTKGAPAELKLNALRSILLGERQRWPDGTKITIALMKTNTPAGISTSRKIYNMSPDELNKYWLALVFQGKGTAPMFFNSAAELENFIATTPGAIGVTTAGGAVRTLTIDGKKSL
jgi:hypothetical protein